MEFVEKREIREMRKKIDEELKKEWMRKLQEFLDSFYRREETMDESQLVDREKVAKQTAELGEATRHIEVASTLLKVLSKMTSDMVKWVVGLIVGAIISVLLVWGALSFTNLATELASFAFLTLFFVMGCIIETRKRIKNYMFLRSQFYELSENPSLYKAKDIIKEIERRELVYA